MNAHLLTVLAAPLITGGFSAPFRIPCQFGGTSGQVALDHLRCLSKTRCVRRLGGLKAEECAALLLCLQEVFSP
ncbi:MAG TPA: type II toxin-antitoxin system PemK/MazF family toxin [Verrucomicrobiae bacterium]